MQACVPMTEAIRTWPGSMARPRTQSVTLPPHVNRVKAGGRVYYYLHLNRGTGKAAKPIRLLDDQRQPEWWDDYRGHVNLPAPKINPNAVSKIVRAWHQSPEWKELAVSMKTNWPLYCDRIVAAWGPLEVKGIEPKHVLALRDKYEDTPAAANNLLRCLSSMMSWSVVRGYRSDNPCDHIKKLTGGAGWEPWPWEIIELAEQKAPRWFWQAVALALYTGQRQGDALAMLPCDVGAGAVNVVQDKTRKKLSIPIHARLKVILEDIDRDAPRILLNTRGEPWTPSGFRASWRKALVGPLAPIAEAGFVFHGPRKSAVVTLLEVGCTDAEVAAITGQSRQMIEHYAKQVNQRKLAASAILKWKRSST